MNILDDHLDWISHEFAASKIGDVRLEARLHKIAADLYAKPSASIPAASGSWAATKAAYRFFSNSFVDSENIDEGPRVSAIERCKQHRLVLAAQDTTSLNYDDHPATKGLGPYSTGKAQGLLMHTTLALTPDNCPLGILDRLTWARDPDEKGKRDQRRDLSIEFKESYKWLTSLNMTSVAAQQCPDTHFVNVGDREADVVDLFLAERPENVDLLVRASWDRRVDHPHAYLNKCVESQPVVATMKLRIFRREDQPAREANLELRYCTVNVIPPKHRSAEKLKKLKLTAILITEVDGPSGATPLRWLLLTTYRVKGVEAALTCAKWYACRWSCEVFHYVLKSGCKIEDLQLEEAGRLMRCLSIYVVVAWRVMFLKHMGRLHPELPCTEVLDQRTWEALYCFVNKVRIPPKVPPTLREAIRLIGKLGGFLGRKSDGEPGMKAMWIGLQRLVDIAEMYETMRPRRPKVSRKRMG